MVQGRESRIEEFWNKFIVVESDLRNNPELYTSILDEWVRIISPELSWEIGPSAAKKIFLAISPNLNIGLLGLTKQIVQKAPKLKHWEILPAKPRKNWEFKWYMEIDGKKVLINAQNWEYILYAFDDGMYEIDILITPLFSRNEDVLHTAAEIALLSELGELEYMTKIDGVKVVHKWTPQESQTKTNIKFLKRHLLHESISSN